VRIGFRSRNTATTGGESDGAMINAERYIQLLASTAANPFDTLHRGSFSCPVRPNQSEDLLVDLERRLLDGDGFATGFADFGDLYDWMHVAFLRIAEH
jgi:hypothetical protein